MENLIIISGSNGYLGKELAKLSIKENYQVIGISRNINTFIKNERFSYISNRSNLSKEVLKDKLINLINGKNFKKKIFINTAWSGETSLSNGNLEKQLSNLMISLGYLDLCSELNFDKFVNVGSLLENYFDQYVNSEWQNGAFPFLNQKNYIFSKTTSRDFCRLKSYLNKIDYIHCIFSVFLDNEITGNGYIHDTLRRIIKFENYQEPSNNEYFDLTNLREGCESILKLCIHGKPNMTYYIGNSDPIKLKDAFHIFKNYRDKKNIFKSRKKHSDRIKKYFDNTNLFEDIGYKPLLTFDEFSKKYFSK